MKCPHCHEEVRGWVKETRQGPDANTYRRRLCEVCGEYFSTKEEVTTQPFPWASAGGTAVTPLAGEIRSRARRTLNGQHKPTTETPSVGAHLHQLWL